MLSFNMKKRALAPSVDDASIIFGAKDGQGDAAPEPFTVATLWAHLVTKLAGLADPAGTAATLAAGALSSATAYTDAEVGEEALARANGDATAIASASSAAATYTNAAIAADKAGTAPVRYDLAQPEIDCLWIAPDGRVVLITGTA